MSQDKVSNHIDHRRYRRRMPPMWPFLLLGMLAQSVFVVFFLMPGMNPVDHQEEIENARVEQKEEKKAQLEEVKQDIQEELQKLKELKDEEDKNKLADELFKEIFNELVDEDIPPEEREAMYEQVKADLNKDLEDAILKIDDFNKKRQEEQLRKAKEAAGKNTEASGKHDENGNATDAENQDGTKNNQDGPKNGAANADANQHGKPGQNDTANADGQQPKGADGQNAAANPNGAANQNAAQQNANGGANQPGDPKQGDQAAGANDPKGAAGQPPPNGIDGQAANKDPNAPGGKNGQAEPSLPQGGHADAKEKSANEALSQTEIDTLREKMIADLAQIADAKANHGFADAAMDVLDKNLAKDIGERMGKKIKDDVGRKMAQKAKDDVAAAKRTEDNNERANKAAEDRYEATKAAIEKANAKDPKHLKALPDAPVKKDDGTQGDALDAESKLLSDKLKGDMESAFLKQFNEVAVPQLSEKIADAIASDAQYSGYDKEKVKETLKPKIEQLLKEKTLAEVKPGENATADAADALTKLRPDVVKDDKTKTNLKSKTAETASADLSNFAKQMEEAMKKAADIQLDLNEEKAGIHEHTGHHGKFAELANKLSGLSNQIQAGRRDILTGRADKVGDLADMRYEQGAGTSNRAYTWDEGLLQRLKNEMANRKNKAGTDIAIEEAQGGIYAHTAEYKQALSELSTFPSVLVDTSVPAPIIARTLPTQVQAPFQSHIFSPIPFLPSKLVMDGNLDDWKDVPWQDLRTAANPGVVQKAKYAYDKRGLWICCDVIDGNKGQTRNQPNDSFWLNDCIEVFVDMLNTKFDKRGTKDTQQFFFYPFGLGSETDVCGGEAIKAGINGNFTMTKYRSDKNDIDTTTVPMRCAKANDHGYQMEMFIPKSAFRSGEFNPGRYIGFNMSVCDDDKYYYYWVPGTDLVHTSEHPDTWGDLNFVGTNATLEFVEESGKTDPANKNLVEYRGARYVIPGQVLTVRVMDRDMDLDPHARNKVEVTVNAGPGNRETVLCEETGNDTGIFIGKILVRPATGENIPNQLELIEGQGVTVEYRDQAREDGHHNYRLTGTLPGAPIGLGVVAVK